MHVCSMHAALVYAYRRKKCAILLYKCLYFVFVFSRSVYLSSESAILSPPLVGAAVQLL